MMCRKVIRKSNSFAASAQKCEFLPGILYPSGLMRGVDQRIASGSGVNHRGVLAGFLPLAAAATAQLCDPPPSAQSRRRKEWYGASRTARERESTAVKSSESRPSLLSRRRLGACGTAWRSRSSSQRWRHPSWLPSSGFGSNTKSTNHRRRRTGNSPNRRRRKKSDSQRPSESCTAMMSRARADVRLHVSRSSERQPSRSLHGVGQECWQGAAPD